MRADPILSKRQWLAEEAAAHIQGWDFSHLDGRCVEPEPLPWDLRTVILDHLRPEHRLLDLDTGGGEFLLSLGHPYKNTWATEGYPPNAELCRQQLSPLGIHFQTVRADGPLPFPDHAFDMVTDRHGSFLAAELARVLRPDGLFLTQQVGWQNDRELVELLLPGTPPPYPDFTLASVTAQLEQAGFEVLRSQEVSRPMRFYDVGALVWFARVIPWEFPGFSVEGCLPQLYKAQELMERDGYVEGHIHHYLIIARRLYGQVSERMKEDSAARMQSYIETIQEPISPL